MKSNISLRIQIADSLRMINFLWNITKLIFKGLFLSLIRDYFKDLETFVKKQYFSSISLRIRKQVLMMTQIKQLNNEIAVHNEECAKLENDLLKKQQRITDTHKYHQSKMKVEYFNKKGEYKRYIRIHFP